MPVFRVRVESLPSRCQICHQADCYDAEADHCARCAPLTLIPSPLIDLTAGINNPLLRNFGWLDGGNTFTILIGRIFSAALAVTLIGMLIGYHNWIKETDADALWGCCNQCVNVDETFFLFAVMIVIYSVIGAVMCWSEGRAVQVRG